MVLLVTLTLDMKSRGLVRCIEVDDRLVVNEDSM